MLDAQLLLEVYLAMTGGQGDLGFAESEAAVDRVASAPADAGPGLRLRVVRADAQAQAAHAARLDRVRKASNDRCLWPA
jgi:DNA polymerase-3 subunit epsilon